MAILPIIARSASSFGLLVGLCIALGAVSPVPTAAQDREFGSTIELIDPNVLRVCADPSNLPFSNEKGEGFENALATFVAEKLGRQSIAYSFFPQATGFVRMTLGSNACDIIMSYPQGDELVQNTNAYYRTAYALVVPKGGELDGVDTLEDPRLKGKVIGVVAGTPPGTYLARAGLIGKARGYQLMVDTRRENSASKMIGDLDKGEIAAAVLWGPQAGYYARESEKEYTVTPLVKEPENGPDMIFRITMGVRVADQEWKRTLNTLIREHQDEINEILLSFGVPLLDEQNNLILSKKHGG